MRQLFETIRESCSASIWSKGVALARARAVVLERRAADELVFKVSVAGKAISPLVSLYPEDEDWSCDCRGREDPCEHVAAAVIAAQRAQERGESLEAPRGAGVRRLGYRFSRVEDSLALTRVVLASDGEHPLRGSILRQVDSGSRLASSKTDIAAELALGQRLAPGRVAKSAVGPLLAALAQGADCRYQGEPVDVRGDALLVWRARLADDGNDFVLQVTRKAELEQLFDNGAVLHGGVLQPVADPPFAGDELAALVAGRRIPAGRAGHLVAEILPAMQAALELEIETKRLPRGEASPPRIVFELAIAEGGLRLLPSIVYGDPATARVDGGRLHLFHPEAAVPLRDEAAEARLSARLRERWGLRAGHAVVIEPGEVAGWSERLRAAAKSGSVELRGEGVLEHYRVVGSLKPRVQGRDDGLTLHFEQGGKTVQGTAVLAAWEAGQRLFELPGGGYAELPIDWLERFGARVAELLAARDPQSERLPAARLLQAAELLEALDVPQPPQLQRLHTALADGFAGVPPAALPADLAAELRDYQRRGVDWLCFLRDVQIGALLADDMGLGKTLQLLAAARGRALVVCPTSVLSNWQREIARFRPRAKICLFHGPSRQLDEQADFTLTSYALLRLDAEKLAREEWDLVALDEAQQIKNAESQAAQSAFSLPARWRVALTGTPVENRLGDLWSLFHFLNRGLLGGRADFEERFAKPIADGHAGAAAELQRRVRPFVLRRKKAEVAPELPPRTEVVWRSTLDEKERAAYDAVRAATREDVLRKLGQGGSVLAALEALLRLRQAACHQALLPGAKTEGAAPSSKLTLLREMLEELVSEGHKALVFSQWTSLLDLVEPVLGDAAIDYCRLDGQTKDRQAVVSRFQSAEESAPPVMLISLRAGGVGLNLTAADHIFILDPWWNPAVEQQAADRAHRIGQDKPVEVHRIVAEGTVEERMLELQEKKRGLAELALEGAASAAISRDDLLELLS